MNASRRRLLTALLVPMLAVRMLLPAGFMPVAGPHGLRIVPCPVGMPAPLHAGHGAHEAPHDHHDGHAGHHPAAGQAGDLDDPPDQASGHERATHCAFAPVAAAAPPVPFVVAMVDLPAAFIASPAAATRPPSTGPPRTDSARGPPALS